MFNLSGLLVKEISLILLIVPMIAIAGSSGDRKLLQVEVTDVFFTVYSVSTPFANEACDVGNPIAFRREDFPGGYDSMLSTALAAYMGGKKISMWFNGCQPSPWTGTMPQPTSIIIKD